MVKRHLRKKRWKKKTTLAVTNFIQKFAPTDMEMEEHVMSLSVKDIRNISSINHEDIDM